MSATIDGEFHEVSDRYLIIKPEVLDKMTAKQIDDLLTCRPGGVIQLSPDFTIVERKHERE